MTAIDAVTAWEVLDSRGNPTVRVTVDSDGQTGRFTVPAGASTGAYEAIERRDGGDRYRGKGVQDAVAAINNKIGPIVVGHNVRDQRGLDDILLELDGTNDLSRLGANAVLGVSGAVMRTASLVEGCPLYEYVATGEPERLPMPMINILSGGLHARGGIEIQDFLVIPTGVDTYSMALETVWEVRQAVRDHILANGNRPLVADEGGFAPPFDEIDDAFELLVSGIEEAGFIPGTDVSIAVDIAATHFFNPVEEVYELSSLDKTLTQTEMIEYVVEWLQKYPIVSVEDPLAEDDWKGWHQLASRIISDVQLLGDDLLVTDLDRLDRAISSGSATAVLVKPNQAGTMTQAIEVIEQATAAGMNSVISARSGETCDTMIADLAVGLGAEQIKIGSLARSERLVKYNRLLKIEATSDCGFTPFEQPTI